MAKLVEMDFFIKEILLKNSRHERSRRSRRSSKQIQHT